MPIDVNVIKSAFDDFEGENFVDAKEKLAGQIKTAKNDYLKTKLGLKGNFMNLPVTPTTPIADPDDLEPEPETELETEPKPKPEPVKRTRRQLHKK